MVPDAANAITSVGGEGPDAVTGAGHGAIAGEGVPENVGEEEPGGITGGGLGESVDEGVGQVAGPVVDETVLSSMTDPNELQTVPAATISPSDTEVIAALMSFPPVPF